MSRINSGQKLLEKLVGSRVISPSGAAWCVIAADPMHDLPLPELCGYPDEQIGESVVLKVPYEFTLAKPAGVTTPTWSFLLTTYPWTFDGAGSAPAAWGYDAYGNWLKTPAALRHSTPALPPVSVYCGNTGNDLGPFQVDVAGNTPVQGLRLDPNYAKGSHRVIGWGTEVYNTTAVVDRQGTCTVWKQNTNTFNKSAWLYAEGPDNIKTVGTATGVPLLRPPENIAEANLLAGTRSWKAEDGCYLVHTQNQEQLLAKQPEDTQPIIFRNDVSPGIRGPLPTDCISGLTATFPLGEENIAVPSVVWDMQPYHMGGAFFTGLSAESTFLIRTIFYVERFPTPDEKDIVLLTKSSAVHDPVALEIYDRMLKNMPIGVPVAENGLGEWFYDAIKTVAPMISAIPHPLAQAAGALGNAYLSAYDSSSKPAQNRNPRPALQAAKALPGPRGPPAQANPQNQNQPAKKNKRRRNKKNKQPQAQKQ